MNELNILLGFDFGTKRIGVAVGQTVTQSARPLQMLPAKDGIPQLDLLDKLFQTWRPDAVVVGIPTNMDGTPMSVTQPAKTFAEFLKNRFHVTVYEWDERLTTKAAREQLFETGGFKALKDGQVDQVAAQLILQSWLNHNVGKK